MAALVVETLFPVTREHRRLDHPGDVCGYANNVSICFFYDCYKNYFS
jgi:hypothetical protein